jgi:3-hydroxyacyl-CoA dehydrogenase
VLSDLPESSMVWKNKDATVRDLGDGILCVSWSSKMNTFGAEVIQGLNKAIDLAEQGYKGLVVYNDGALFSAGANVGMIFMMAVEQEYEDLDMAIRTFQNTMMRMRHSSIPVVAAPHQLCLGGGTELCLHADKVVAHAETYMGLVEFGVGVIPGGGGTKEFALRLSDELKEGDIRINAHARALPHHRPGQGEHQRRRSLRPRLPAPRPGRGDREPRPPAGLRQGLRARPLEQGLHQAAHAQGHQGAGPEGLGIVYVGANSMQSGNYISEHDALISEKLGHVLCGGDLSESHRGFGTIPAGPGAEGVP